MRNPLLAVCFILTTTSALAQLSLCNKTGRTIAVHIALPNPASSYIISAAIVNPNDCVQVTKNFPTVFYMYAQQIQAQGDQGVNFHEWSGDLPLCLAGQSLPPCIHAGWEKKFKRIETGNVSMYTFTFNCQGEGCDANIPSKEFGPSITLPAVSTTRSAGTRTGATIQLSTAQGTKPDWQAGLDWCSSNMDAGGSVDCVADYLASYPKCWVSGGRSCIMTVAKQSARDHDCANAFKLALMCQCHNHSAQQAIEQAGQSDVCLYLGPPSPSQPPATPQPMHRQTYTPSMPDYTVSLRYRCRYADGGAAGDCTITAHSKSSCQDARQIILDKVESSGDVCKHCPDTAITDNSKSQNGGPLDVTGAGSCFAP